jgi:hypothetical protein
MNILAILLSLFLGSALYWYLNWYNKPKKDKKYCPCCGRMLLVYEQEERKAVEKDGFYKVDYTHDVKKAKDSTIIPFSSAGVYGTTSWGGTATFPTPSFQYKSF